MKKRFLECGIHGLTLFRCRRKCWKRGTKDKVYATDYSEQCFKCISEGRCKKEKKEEKRIRHFKV